MQRQTSTAVKEENMQSSKTFYFARNISEIFQQIRNIARLSILGGCTTYSLWGKSFSENNLSIRNIEELKSLEKKERYLEIGSETTLSEIESLGKSNLPPVLYEAVKSIATPFVRNLATIGGNICAPDFYYTLYAPLLALDARLDFISENETAAMSMSKFKEVPEGSILSKVRIPFYDWTISIFKRVGPVNIIDSTSASFVFLADTNKGQLSALRIAFAGIFKFQDKELENKLIGAHLPLSANTISDFMADAEESFKKVSEKANAHPVLERQFTNLLNWSLEQLT